MNLMVVKEINDTQELLALYPFLKLLNADMQQQEFEQLLKEVMQLNYKMFCVYKDDTCIAIAGCWIGTKFYSGKYLEMDNVVVLPEYRNLGAGKLLCDFFLQYAQQQQCKTIMLDAYRENTAAHRFYEREGFIKKGFHFIKRL